MATLGGMKLPSSPSSSPGISAVDAGETPLGEDGRINRNIYQRMESDGYVGTKSITEVIALIELPARRFTHSFGTGHQFRTKA